MASSTKGAGAKKGKKNRKHLRNKMRSPSAKAYSAEGRNAKNKKKKLMSHLFKHPKDHQALTSVVPNYKLVKLTPEKAAEFKRQQTWKRYLKGA